MAEDIVRDLSSESPAEAMNDRPHQANSLLRGGDSEAASDEAEQNNGSHAETPWESRFAISPALAQRSRNSATE
jgi:hypothetical protein